MVVVMEVIASVGIVEVRKLIKRYALWSPFTLDKVYTIPVIIPTLRDRGF